MTSLNPPKLILASASPRRQELLREAGYLFLVHPANVDEERFPPGLSPAGLAEYLAVQKAQAAARFFPEAAVLGADTVVALDAKILGKPADAAHAREMLSLLSGTTHTVITGVALVDQGHTVQTRVVSSVQMRPLTDMEITRYVASGHWQGKAGGYGIQDPDPFVTRISGSHTNIVGLPMEATQEMLAKIGIQPGAV